MRERPRAALVDTDDGTVISTCNRVTCGPDDGFVATIAADWPADAVAVIEMDTGEPVTVAG